MGAVRERKLKRACSRSPMGLGDMVDWLLTPGCIKKEKGLVEDGGGSTLQSWGREIAQSHLRRNYPERLSEEATGS